MSKFCCITDLIRFMMREAENLMKGSVHEDDLFIVHDALVLMTAKETIEWMKENNCRGETARGRSSVICQVDNFQRFQRQINIFYNSR